MKSTISTIIQARVHLKKAGNMIKYQRATLERFIHVLCTQKSVHLDLGLALCAEWGLNLKL
jgi:hypothetical protein